MALCALAVCMPASAVELPQVQRQGQRDVQAQLRQNPLAGKRLGIDIRHNPESGVVNVVLTEATVVLMYLSGCLVFIGGLGLGCILWQRAQVAEPCNCRACAGVYRARRSLGSGGFGEATLVVRCGRPYVLKRIGCQTINEANQALQEASCLQRLQHPGVVRFEDVFLHRHDNGGCSVQIAMEFCAGGDMIDRLECRRNELPLTERQLVHFLGVLSRTLFHVHQNGILHRDLKTSNIFVTKNDRTVKLGDFGLACTNLSRRRMADSPRRRSRCGTTLYMSPEVERRRPYGAPSDVYGLGCVLLEMLIQQQLRERRRFESRTDSIKAALHHARRAHSWITIDKLSNLAWRMLDENPKTRIKLIDTAAIADACLEEIPASAFCFPIPTAGAAPRADSPKSGRRTLQQSDSDLQAARRRRLRIRYAPD